MAAASQLGARDDGQEKGTVQALAFKAEEAGKCSDGWGEGESTWQARDEAWICDSGAPTHMTPSADSMINYRNCNPKLRVADGSTRSIDGYRDINFVCQPGNDLVQVLITNVAHVPNLRYHLLFLPTFVKNGHTSERLPTRVVIRLSPERSILFPSSGTLYSLYGYRGHRSCRENTCTVLAPGQLPHKLRLTSTTSTARLENPTGYLCARPLSSKGLPSRESCRSAKGATWRRVSAKVSSRPHTRPDKKLVSRGPKAAESLGRTRNTLIVRGEFFTIYVGVPYAAQAGCRGIVRATPCGVSFRRCRFNGCSHPI